MNTWVICSMCHKKVHHLTYKGHTLKKNKTNEQSSKEHEKCKLRHDQENYEIGTKVSLY